MSDVETKMVRRRKPRRSRGRGLRTTAGCLICKQRHVKCDEERPQCGPCRKGQRPCAYEPTQTTEAKRPQVNQQEPPGFHHISIQEELPNNEHNNTPSPSATRGSNFQLGGPESPLSYRTSGISPGTDVSSRHAPYSWFELLATDVANIDQNFLLSPLGDSQAPVAASSQSVNGGSPSNSLLIPRNLREKQSFQAAAFGDILVTSTANFPPVETPAVFRDDRSCWTVPGQIQLTPVEASIFTHFIRQLSCWMDFFDPLKHFGTLIPHLALNNTGLMKALLALSARHISLCADKKSAELDETYSTSDVEAQARKVSREMSVQFYYETLQYLHKAMHYKSYTKSQELLGTAILISTYEMIDGSNQDWERHLKGVFWIQRSQDNDGESGGLRQAVWWTWLQQDIWVALIERRRVFSFWHPKRPLASLNTPDLACRAIYLLAQCVNYASNEEREGNSIGERAQRGNELLRMLEDWAQHVPPEFSPLPIAQSPSLRQDFVFPPIWIHPPSYAAAYQVHNLSRILVLTHRPLSGGPLDYAIVQRTIRKAVDIVCGIAQTVDKDSTPANYISVLCLFVAGTTLHVNHQRALVLGLIEACERRISWSDRSLRTALESEWRKIDGGEGSFRLTSF